MNKSLRRILISTALVITIIISCSCVKLYVKSGTQGDSAALESTSGKPRGWPESVKIMEGLTVENGIRTDHGKLLQVSASGDISLNDAQKYYSSLEGWRQDQSWTWVTTGDFRAVTLINEKKEKLEITIKRKREQDGQTTLRIIWTSADYNPDPYASYHTEPEG